MACDPVLGAVGSAGAVQGWAEEAGRMREEASVGVLPRVHGVG